MKFGPKLTPNEQDNLTILYNLLMYHETIIKIIGQNAGSARNAAETINQLLMDNAAMSLQEDYR